MNQDMTTDLKILERMACLHLKEDNQSIEEYMKHQKGIVTKYKILLDAMARAGLLTVCLWSINKKEFIGWDVKSVVENGNFQLNTPVENQNSNSFPIDKIFKEIYEITK